MTATRPPRSERLPAPVLVLTGIASVQVGNAWADTLFDHVHAGGAGLLRLVWAAVVMALIYRPRLRRGRDEWLPALALGVVLAAMNLTFYHAIAHLPLGIAVTVEFVGPLAVAVGHSRRRRDLIWVALAAVGIVALAQSGGHQVTAIGLILAALAGACWGVYILLQARLGQTFADGSGLALAMLVAAVVAIPDGTIEGGAHLLVPGTLAVGLAVGLLSSVVPYSLELIVLRRMSPGIFGVLMSIEPAAAAIAGVIVLSQGLSLRQVIGMALVSSASLGASLAGAADPEDPGSPPGAEATADPEALGHLAG